MKKVLFVLFCFCAYLTGNILCSMTMIIVYSFLSSFMIKEKVMNKVKSVDLQNLKC